MNQHNMKHFTITIIILQVNKIKHPFHTWESDALKYRNYYEHNVFKV